MSSKEKRQFDTDKIPYRERETGPARPGVCSDFLEGKEDFRWFIVKYFGSVKFTELIQLAESQKEQELKSALNDIWFRLPDNIFNIRERPRGWMRFLELVED